MNKIFKNESSKEFECRQCTIFLNSNELIKGKCPDCENDEDLFENSINEEE